jgi:hypothetical protein
MSRWQVAARCAAYLVVLLLGVRWTWAAAVSLQHPLFDSDARLVDDATIALGALLGLKLQGTLWIAALVLSVKPLIGAYLLLTVALAVGALAVHGKADPARLDAGLLLSVIAVMLAAAPWLVAARIGPGAIDDLTLAVIGITFAALSRPEFLADQPAVQSAQ